MEYKYEWMNGKFINSDFWAGRNFPLYVFDKENEKKQYFGHVHKDPIKGQMMIMNPELRDDQKFWDFACATSPDICCYVPEAFHTPALLKVIATNTSWKRNLKWMAMENLMREEAEEIYAIMAARFYEAISDIPEEFLTDKVVNPALVNHILALSKLPEEERTDDRCILSVKTWGKSLRAVPEEKKCLEVITDDGVKPLYEVAVDVDPMSLAAVPNAELTSELCLKAVKANPLAISYVPVRFITPEFVQELKENDIVVPPKSRCYIRECLRIWAKRNGIVDMKEAEFNMVLDSSKNLEWKNIRLADMPYMFSKRVLDKLESRGVTNLGQLFETYDSERFESDPFFAPGDLSLELAGTINVLNCKFRGRDPMIDLDSTDNVYMQSMLGLPKAFAREVSRRGFSVRDLLEELDASYQKQVWNNFYGWSRVGDGSINSAIERLSIVSNYYFHVPDDQKLANTIAQLNEEIAGLKQQSLALDGMINDRLKRIADLERQNAKDGGVSYVKK